MNRTCRIGLMLLTPLLIMACRKEEQKYLDPLVTMERGGYRDQGLDQRRIDEIRQGIHRYQKEVDRKVEATAQIGIYYKMLAVEFMRSGMYREAYKNLEQALEIHPENTILFYLSGVSAARLAKARVDAEEREQWLKRGEFLYRRAVELDPGYTDALYGLAVLLTFELARVEEAEVLVKRILERESKHIEAMFLLAGIYYRLGRLEETIQQYDQIARSTRVKAKREEALRNRQSVEDELYGAQ